MLIEKVESFNYANPQSDEEKAIVELIKYYEDVEEIFKNLNKNKFDARGLATILNVASMAKCNMVIGFITDHIPDKDVLIFVDYMEETFKAYMNQHKEMAKKRMVENNE